jgi:hypothetical protein
VFAAGARQRRVEKIENITPQDLQRMLQITLQKLSPGHAFARTPVHKVMHVLLLHFHAKFVQILHDASEHSRSYDTPRWEQQHSCFDQPIFDQARRINCFPSL